MNARHMIRPFLLALPVAAPLTLAFALTGCDGGGSEKTETNAPGTAVKQSESNYEAEIAKQKAAAKPGAK